MAKREALNCLILDYTKNEKFAKIYKLKYIKIIIREVKIL
jgi:hypothetical protein